MKFSKPFVRIILPLIILIVQMQAAFAQNPVSGQVSDSTGTPLAGVSVSVKGTKKGTSTDQQGHFTIAAPANATLVFSFVGFDSREMSAASNLANVMLVSSSANTTEGVIVTALGIKRQEKSLGYAVQKVGGDALQTVKGVDVGTSLTGKVAGLVVFNSTEFNARPTLEMRGESPLLVINGVPYGNMTLRDIPTDDIESIDMLKGPTAAALYGVRGASGAVMITTKKGKGKGLSVDVNSNNMATLGYIAIPKVQSSYGHGEGGQITDDYIWGPKLDIGTIASQWNPVTKQMEDMPLVASGKNNLRNFMNTGLISNNSISVTQSGENGYFRAAVNHIYNKGQFPNAKLNITNFTLNGQMKVGDKFVMESQMGYTRKASPQVWGSGYGSQGYMYQLLMWTGADYDIRQYKDYWVKPNVSQNWLYKNWYDNPYFIAYQKLQGTNENKLNASLNATYSFTKDLKLMVRTGYDYYKNELTASNSQGVISTRGSSSGTFGWTWNAKGLFGQQQTWGFSTNNDVILSYNKKVGKLGIDALAGGTIYYYEDREFGARTRNGLSVPGWYSLANAVPSTTAGVDALVTNYATYKKQINSAYGKLSLSWDNYLYVDVTGRNDWSSTQPKSERSYFYPSVAGSFILSEVLPMPKWLNMWKLRGSWTISKDIADVYEINRTYSTGSAWGYNTSSYPGGLLPADIKPTTFRTWEFGTAAYLLNKRLHVDAAFFSKLAYNQQISQTISSGSGFSTTLINTNEDIVRRGVEVTIDGTVIKRRNFEWNSAVNYSFQHRYFAKLDPVYSADDAFTKKGGRIDTYTNYPFLKDPEGNLIHEGGYPVTSDYDYQIGYGEPDFSLGFINNFTIGNFNVGISMDGRIGGLMYNYIWDKMFDTGANPETDNQNRYNQVVNGDDSYIGKGVKVISGEATYDKYGKILTDTRKYGTNDVEVGYESYIRDGIAGYGDHGIMNESFWKIREVSVGYRIPRNWLGKSGIKSASVSLTAQNVLLITGFKYSDPDIDTENLNSPSQRMVGVNVRLGF